MNFKELRETGFQPRLHPNGFIQLDLDTLGQTRLHVWPDEPLPAQKTFHPIHDHVFDMESQIIRGHLTNITYAFRYTEEGAYILHMAQPINSQDTILSPVSKSGILVNISNTTYPTSNGMNRYHLDAFVLHESIPNGLTVTIMSKGKVYPYRPLIAVPVGVEPDNEFRRDQVDAEILWKWIEKGLESSAVIISGIGEKVL